MKTKIQGKVISQKEENDMNTTTTALSEKTLKVALEATRQHRYQVVKACPYQTRTKEQDTIIEELSNTIAELNEVVYHKITLKGLKQLHDEGNSVCIKWGETYYDDIHRFNELPKGYYDVNYNNNQSISRHSSDELYIVPEETRGNRVTATMVHGGVFG